ncbi:MAG: hypothetical protein LBM93_13175 [Oscillospiraceae bacterium]|jgi:hypothetical protein|nr:hypothetical protein [Oscillospiraceae bacterium]
MDFFEYYETVKDNTLLYIVSKDVVILPEEFSDGWSKLGLQSLKEQSGRRGYFAFIDHSKVVLDVLENQGVDFKYNFNGFEIKAAAYHNDSCEDSLLVKDNINYCANIRGFNFTLFFDDGKIELYSCDTYAAKKPFVDLTKNFEDAKKIRYTFLYTCIGNCNSDMNWWNANLPLFEHITLPSMENAVLDKNTHWVISTNALTTPPLILKKLKQLIYNSKVRDNVFFYTPEVKGNAAFSKLQFVLIEHINSFIQDGEYYVHMQIDADDAIEKTVLQRINFFAREKVKEFGLHKFVFSMENYLKYDIFNKNPVLAKCFFENILSYSFTNENKKLLNSHAFLGNADNPRWNSDYFKTYKKYIMPDKTIGGVYVIGASSSENTLNKRTGKINVETLSSKHLRLLNNCGINYFYDFENLNPHLENRLMYSTAPFKKMLNTAKVLDEQYKNMFKKALDYTDIEKKELRNSVIKLQGDKTWLQAISEYYELDCYQDSKLTEITNAEKYLEYIKNTENISVYICESGDNPYLYAKHNNEVYEKFGEKNTDYYYSGKGINHIHLKSVNTNNKNISSIEFYMLEYSMNLPGKNIVCIRDFKIIDICNINNFIIYRF